jgi:hypothetical protein
MVAFYTARQKPASILRLARNWPHAEQFLSTNPAV